MDTTKSVIIVRNFAGSISIWFFKHIMRKFLIIWFLPYFETLKVQNWQFLPFYELNSNFRRSKFRKLLYSILRKVYQELEYQKLGLNHKYWDAWIFSQNRSWKLLNLKIYWNSHVFCHMSLRKNTITFSWSKISYFCKK